MGCKPYEAREHQAVLARRRIVSISAVILPAAYRNVPAMKMLMP
jgi:hypothetical protein